MRDRQIKGILDKKMVSEMSKRENGKPIGSVRCLGFHDANPLLEILREHGVDAARRAAGPHGRRSTLSMPASLLGQAVRRCPVCRSLLEWTLQSGQIACADCTQPRPANVAIEAVGWTEPGPDDEPVLVELAEAKRRERGAGERPPRADQVAMAEDSVAPDSGFAEGGHSVPRTPASQALSGTGRDARACGRAALIEQAQRTSGPSSPETPWPTAAATFVLLLTPDDLPQQFEFGQGVTVVSRAKFLEALKRDTMLGPKGPRARYGALQGDIVRLRDYLFRRYGG